jgi:hypothetical protein
MLISVNTGRVAAQRRMALPEGYSTLSQGLKQLAGMLLG